MSSIFISQVIAERFHYLFLFKFLLVSNFHFSSKLFFIFSTAFCVFFLIPHMCHNLIMGNSEVFQVSSKTNFVFPYHFIAVKYVSNFVLPSWWLRLMNSVPIFLAPLSPASPRSCRPYYGLATHNAVLYRGINWPYVSFVVKILLPATPPHPPDSIPAMQFATHLGNPRSFLHARLSSSSTSFLALPTSYSSSLYIILHSHIS